MLPTPLYTYHKHTSLKTTTITIITPHTSIEYMQAYFVLQLVPRWLVHVTVPESLVIVKLFSTDKEPFH